MHQDHLKPPARTRRKRIFATGTTTLLRRSDRAVAGLITTIFPTSGFPWAGVAQLEHHPSETHHIGPEAVGGVVRKVRQPDGIYQRPQKAPLRWRLPGRQSSQENLQLGLQSEHATTLTARGYTAGDILNSRDPPAPIQGTLLGLPHFQCVSELRVRRIVARVEKA